MIQMRKAVASNATARSFRTISNWIQNNSFQSSRFRRHAPKPQSKFICGQQFKQVQSLPLAELGGPRARILTVHTTSKTKLVHLTAPKLAFVCELNAFRLVLWWMLIAGTRGIDMDHAKRAPRQGSMPPPGRACVRPNLFTLLPLRDMYVFDLDIPSTTWSNSIEKSYFYVTKSESCLSARLVPAAQIRPL
ncbi:hypothetical protein WA026_004481 [Henosepilachna vigintioctopunctata]|uniref:Uncharacterized protein n=1 Tax=Henosepilachna vigintioctopunctata TaxID=420089 RepID=A0AAW1VAE0_9CUCU